MERRLPALLAGGALAVLLLATLLRAAGGWLSLHWDVVGLAVPMLLAPVWLREGMRGVRRGRALLPLLGSRTLLLGADVPVERTGWVLRGAQLLLPVLEGLLVLDLALHWRDVRARGRRFAAALLLSTAAALGVLAALPFSEGGAMPLLPARWQRLAEHLDLLCWALAWGLHRKAFASPRGALDREGGRWVGRGLLVGILFSLLGLWAGSVPSGRPLPVRPASLRAWGVFAVGLGHLWLLAPSLRPRLGLPVRRAVAWLLVAAGSGAVAVLLQGWLSGSFASWPEAAVKGAWLGMLGAALHPSASAWTARWLAPAGGRWLRAAHSAQDALGRGVHEGFEEVASAVLGPLSALDPGGGGGWIFWLDPPREMRLEPSGTVRIRQVGPPDPLREWLEKGDPWVHREELAPFRVRRPEVRALLEVLEAHGALFAVRMGSPEDSAGLLLVPAGGRRSAPSEEELRAYADLGAVSCEALEAVAAVCRAQRRAGEASVRAERLQERCEELAQRVERLAEENRMLREGRGAGRVREPLVLLSAASRELRERLITLAPQRVPVWIEARGGIPVDRYARLLHEEGSTGPFVVADCASVPPEEAFERLFGSGGQGALLGWVPSAEGGTLLLADLPALPEAAQQALAEVLAAHRRPAGDGGTEPCEVRIVASGRLPLRVLRDRGAVAPELFTWLEAAALRIPPLRERREEIEPLVLRALTRACRLQGRKPVGLQPEAFELLLDYGWPGNERELQFVVERAVASAEGDRIGPEAVRALLTREEPEPEDPLSGTFAEVERRLLRQALRRAAGNKSRAAELLGLKRSTFLSKLKRHGM